MCEVKKEISEIKSISDISVNPEGRLLCRVIGLIMTQPRFTGKTPEEVLALLTKVK